MKNIRILRLAPEGPLDQGALAAAADALRQGKLILMPTDTVYGVAALASRPEAVAMLGRLKGRPDGKPIPLLAANQAEIEKSGAALNRTAQVLAAKFWPGPLTLVLAVGDGWEGFRIPDHPVALAIIRAVGGLLRATSANLSGQAPARDAAAALQALGHGVALAVDAGPAPGGRPSTVVKMEGARAVVLREGALSASVIAAACRRAAT